MALLCAANALCCPVPSRLLGHCNDRRRLQFAGATGADNISVMAVSGRNTKLSAASMPARAGAEQESLGFPLRAEGLANVLAIGIANPANCVLQEDFPDWFFRVTKSDHLTHLKTKMKKICRKTEIHKRYFHYDEELLRSHREFLDGALPSLDARQAIAATAVPELAAAAGAKAIAEWGRPASDITHVIFCTYSATHMPGADLRLASRLGLCPRVERTVLYNGCNSGSIALRLAKDIAQNNRGARVLVACAETTLVGFRAPDETSTDTLVVSALFGDGAGAVIVGSDPETTGTGGECPLFEMVSSAQSAIPGTEHVVSTRLGACGLVYDLSSELPALVAANVERCLVDAWEPLGLTMGCDWNDLFWVVHPGGRAVLDGVQDALDLKECKLGASRRVLSEYGNMSGVTIVFVLDEMRRRRRRRSSNGDVEKESEWGAMVGFGPGLTVETMLLRAMGN